MKRLVQDKEGHLFVVEDILFDEEELDAIYHAVRTYRSSMKCHKPGSRWAVLGRVEAKLGGPSSV